MNRALAIMDALNPVNLPSVSMESVDVADGKTKVEKEIEIYGTMRNMDDLDASTHWEIQEQWGLYVPGSNDNAGSGNVRIRMSQRSSGEPVYVLTTKVKAPTGNLECEAPSSPDMFHLFKVLASSGLRKKRYYFPIPGTEMEFEVDVFTGPTGAPVPHVKIDLELRGTVAPDFDLTSITLPFEMSDIRIISPGHKSDEDLAYVRELFKTQYDLPNQCKEIVSLEEMAPPGCECGRCGWGSGGCPGVAERKQKEAEVDSKASTANLETNKEALVELADRCSGMAGALSYNDTRREASLKSSLHGLTNTIQAALLNKGGDADTFHNDLKARIRGDGDHEFR